MTIRFSMMAMLLLAGCGVSGPPELGFVPPPVDMHADLGKIDAGTALAAPAGWTPAPSLVTPVYAVAAPQLLAAMQQIVLEQPRTWQTASHPEQQQAAFIVRSLAMNFPDVVIVQAIPDTATTSKAVIFSQSRYPLLPILLSDNQDRVRRLVKALADRVGTAAPVATAGAKG